MVFSFLSYFLSALACANCWLNLLLLFHTLAHSAVSLSFCHEHEFVFLRSFVLSFLQSAHQLLCYIPWFLNDSISLCVMLCRLVHISIAPPSTIAHCVPFSILCSVAITIDMKRPRHRSQFLVNSTLTYWLNVIFLLFSLVNALKKGTHTRTQHCAWVCDCVGKVNQTAVHVCTHFTHRTIFPHDETKILEFKREKNRA